MNVERWTEYAMGGKKFPPIFCYGNDIAVGPADPVILYLQDETKIAKFRYLRKWTEAVKDKDY